MSEELQQNLKDYSYEAYGAIPLPTAVPPMAHNATSMPRDCAVSNTQESFASSDKHSPRWLFQIPPVSDVSQDSIFSLPPASYPAYREPCRVGYQQIYGPLAPVGLLASDPHRIRSKKNHRATAPHALTARHVPRTLTNSSITMYLRLHVPPHPGLFMDNPLSSASFVICNPRTKSSHLRTHRSAE